VRNMRHFARYFPQQDVNPFYGSRYWLTWVDTPLYWDDVDMKSDDGDDMGDIRDAVSDFLEPSGNWKGIALVDQMTVDPTSQALGQWGEWYDTGIVENTRGVGGKTMMHEAMHNLGLVSIWSPNWDGPSDFWELFDANAWTHSRYDEGQWFDRDEADFNIDECVVGRRYRDALTHQVGVLRQLVILMEDSAPTRVRAQSCGEREFAKSVISYAPLRDNTNSFLEPADYRYILDDAFARAKAAERAALAPKADRTLRFHALVNQSGLVTPTISYVEETPGQISTPDGQGAYKLLVKDGSGQVLSELPFGLSFQQGHIHGQEDSQQILLGESAQRPLLLRTAWPNGADRVELLKDNGLIWSQDVSSNAPTVSFVTPNGGTFNPETGVAISWTANDQDGDNLLFGLDYSADGGTTWTTVAPSLTGTSYQWKPGYIQASATARLRLRASDGILTGSAVSAPFNLTARPPVAYIIDPVADQTFTEGSLLYLLGGSMTSQGMDAGGFAWRYDGAAIGSGQAISYSLNETGVHTFTVQVTVGGQNASASVAVTVVADTDKDGMPNAWEQAKQFNPLWAGDVNDDADGDGLTNGQEYDLGTEPRVKDSDGDGAEDGAEVAAGTDPLNPNDKPATSASLVTGATSLRFTGLMGGVAADQSFWITNGGPGALGYTASSDSAWLKLSPENGNTPSQMTISVDLSGLVPGEYTGKITVQSPGAAGSPDEVTVFLQVTDPNAFRMFVPIVSR